MSYSKPVYHADQNRADQSGDQSVQAGDGALRIHDPGHNAQQQRHSRAAGHIQSAGNNHHSLSHRQQDQRRKGVGIADMYAW